MFDSCKSCYHGTCFYYIHLCRPYSSGTQLKNKYIVGQFLCLFFIVASIDLSSPTIRSTSSADTGGGKIDVGHNKEKRKKLDWPHSKRRLPWERNNRKENGGTKRKSYEDQDKNSWTG